MHVRRGERHFFWSHQNLLPYREKKMKPIAAGSPFGKYWKIILAVVVFMVLDLSVLALNFYTSFQIDQDTVAINLSGRQRYVSQRIARTLLELDAARAAGQSYKPETLDELKKGTAIFQVSMVAFREGGTIPGGDGKPVRLEPVTSPRGRELEDKVEAIWKPYYKLLQPIVTKPDFTPEELAAALAYSQANNIRLLNIANDFVTEAQAIGGSRAAKLRTIQTTGILLSLLNFIYTVFASLRHLLANDRKVEEARKETAEILGTVKDGLFLLDPKMQIGSQYSESLPRILGRAITPGLDFPTLLKGMVPDSVMTLACEYVELLFADRIKESLMGDLNPLNEFEVSVPGPNGEPVRRFLKVQFNRVLEQGKIAHLLVTVVDVTVQVELERALTTAKQKAKAEMEIMLDLLKVNPVTLEHYLDDAERTLLEINDQLRSAGETTNYRNTVNTVFRRIHTLKGEAAALELEMFENLAQQFESLLTDLRQKGDISGDDLLALPFPLEEFLQRIASVRSLVGRLASYHDAFAAPPDHEVFADNLSKLAVRIAQDHGKQVQLTADLGLLESIPQDTRKEVKDIMVQLLRNAVAHGIEPASERAQLAKPASGNIHLTLKPTDNGEYELMMRDDGRGLVPRRIRDHLLRTKRYTEAQLAELDDRQIVMKIFEPGFSTSTANTRDAGHGVGMDVVKHKIEQIGARIRISSRENAFTQFSIHFAT
jgi:two-component system chemotaxis sensor kinase CheA